MKWAVVTFPGSNCDEDAAAAIRRVTGDPVDMVWHQQADLSAYAAIVLPGGFSYGDYLRSGAIARYSPAMGAVAQADRRRQTCDWDLQRFSSIDRGSAVAWGAAPK